MKGNDHYPKNISNAYKYLNEYNTSNSAKESYSRHSNYLAFLQGNPKDSGKACYNSGNPGYIVRTCPVCNTKMQQNPEQGALKKKESSPNEIGTNMRCIIKNLNPKQPIGFHPEYITNVLSLALLKN